MTDQIDQPSTGAESAKADNLARFVVGAGKNLCIPDFDASITPSTLPTCSTSETCSTSTIRRGKGDLATVASAFAEEPDAIVVGTNTSASVQIAAAVARRRGELTPMIWFDEITVRDDAAEKLTHIVLGGSAECRPDRFDHMIRDLNVITVDREQLRTLAENSPYDGNRTIVLLDSVAMVEDTEHAAAAFQAAQVLAITIAATVDLLPALDQAIHRDSLEQAVHLGTLEPVFELQKILSQVMRINQPIGGDEPMNAQERLFSEDRSIGLIIINQLERSPSFDVSYLQDDLSAKGHNWQALNEASFSPGRANRGNKRQRGGKKR